MGDISTSLPPTSATAATATADDAELKLPINRDISISALDQSWAGFISERRSHSKLWKNELTLFGANFVAQRPRSALLGSLTLSDSPKMLDEQAFRLAQAKAAELDWLLRTDDHTAVPPFQQLLLYQFTAHSVAELLPSHAASLVLDTFSPLPCYCESSSTQQPHHVPAPAYVHVLAMQQPAAATDPVRELFHDEVQNDLPLMTSRLVMWCWSYAVGLTHSRSSHPLGRCLAAFHSRMLHQLSQATSARWRAHTSNQHVAPPSPINRQTTDSEGVPTHTDLLNGTLLEIWNSLACFTHCT
jgi:hypothetical protein